MREYNVLPKHLDGIVSQLRVTKDVEAAVFYTRQMKKIIKSAPVLQVMWMLQRSQQNMAVADMSGSRFFRGGRSGKRLNEIIEDIREQITD